jgi:L-rhamnose mutarotase
MLRAIRDAGWANYTIFMRDDGTVVGYMETDDLKLATERMNQSDVSASWAAATSHLFENPQEWLEPVFNLDDQLRAAGLS